MGRRTLVISFAVLIPALLLLILLSFGSEKPRSFWAEPVSMVSLRVNEVSEETPEPASTEREQAKERPVSPKPSDEQPPPPEPVQPLPSTISWNIFWS